MDCLDLIVARHAMGRNASCARSQQKGRVRQNASLWNTRTSSEANLLAPNRPNQVSPSYADNAASYPNMTGFWPDFRASRFARVSNKNALGRPTFSLRQGTVFFDTGPVIPHHRLAPRLC